MHDAPTPPGPEGQAALRTALQPGGPERPPRPGRGHRVLVVVGAVLAAVVAAGGLTYAYGESASSTVSLQGPAWQCDDAELVPADDPMGGSGTDDADEARLIPVVDTGTVCWGSWTVTSTRDDVTVDRLVLPFGGADTGGAFRIDAARVDGEPVDLVVPVRMGQVPEPVYETVVPVERRVGPSGTTVSVRVVPGDGCSVGALGMLPELDLHVGRLPWGWPTPEGVDVLRDDPGLALAFPEGGRGDCGAG